MSNPLFAMYGCYIPGKRVQDTFFVQGDHPGKTYESGDLIKIRRTPEGLPQLAVVLGYGGDKDTARKRANEYLVWVGEVDGVEDPTELEFECTQDLI